MLKPQILNLIKSAIGKQVTIRLDRYTTITGVIDSCEFVKWRNRGGDRICVFKMYLIAGEAKVRHCLIVERLPWRDGCTITGKFSE